MGKRRKKENAREVGTSIEREQEEVGSRAGLSSAKIKEESAAVVRKSVLIKAVSSEIPLSRPAAATGAPGF